MTTTRKTLALTALGLAAMMFAGCASPAATAGTADKPAALRLGYFANLTHAPALIGVEEGLFQDALGDTALKTEVFNAGPAAVEALSAGAIDAAYLGPSPAINSYIQSAGRSATIIAGATSGGAALVVRDGIDSPKDLAGTTLATPQLGNTQDVALRSWLREQGLSTTLSGGGDVAITPTENAQALSLFQSGKLDGAWLPEPWASRLVTDAGAHVLVDEATLWPGGTFPTTVLLVRKDFAAQHPALVTDLLQGHVAAVDWLAAHPDTAAGEINDALEDATGTRLSDDVLTRALAHVTFTLDPNAAAFDTLVAHGITAGTQKKGSIDGLFSLDALNKLLTADGREPISGEG